jgi:uncharacterized protein (TIGR02246 family)
MKRQIGVLLMCLVVALVSFGQTGPAPTTATAPAASSGILDPNDPTMLEIKAMRDGLVDAFNKGDMEKVLTYVHPDVTVTWANAEVSHGHKGVREYHDKMMKGPEKRVDWVKINPKVEGRKMYGADALISFGSLDDVYHLTDGSEFNMQSRFSSLLVRENGKWLIKGFHASGNLFDNPVQNIVVKKVSLWVGIIAGVVGLLLGMGLMAMMKRKRAV